MHNLPAKLSAATLPEWLAAQQYEHDAAARKLSEHMRAAEALAAYYRRGRVCRVCERPCSCDLQAEGSREDRWLYAEVRREVASLKAMADRLGRRLTRGNRALKFIQVPSPRLPQTQNMMEAA